MNRFAVGVRANLRTFVRTPLNVVLALVLPLVVIEGWGQAMAGLPSLPTVEAIPLDLGRLLGAIFGVAIIAGLMGLVQMISAREADRRLVQAGYSPRTLLATRLATLAGVTVVVGAVLPRLFEGSLVVVFLAMMDAFLSGDSPLAADVPEFVEYFPLYHPKELLQSAAFDGTFASGDLVFVGGYVLVLLVLVTAVFGATMRTAGGWSA